MPNLYESHLFRDYTKAVKDFVQSSVYLSRFPKENNWQVFFETLDQGYANRIIPIINGHNTGPNGFLQMNEPQFIEEEAIGGYFFKLNKNENGDYDAEVPPLVYRLEYTLTFFTSTRVDMDIVNYQLLTKAPKTRKFPVIVNENWCEIYVHSPVDETNLEPEEAKTKIRRGSLKITIPRAFLNYPVQREGIPEILEIDTQIDTKDDVYV